MCVFSTEENQKDKYLEQTLESLKNTVDFSKHRLQLSVNGYTEKTKEILTKYSDIIEKIHWNESNEGTARGINRCWINRKEKEHCHKIDDDIETSHVGWLDELEEVLEADSNIGQAALKRTDLWENPYHQNSFYRSELKQLPHKPGNRWLNCEFVNHCIGSSVLHSYKLLDIVGGLRQPSYYAFDDAIMSAVSKLAGFKNVFLSHILIKHLDEGGTSFQEEKEKMAYKYMEEYNKLIAGYTNGTIPLYHPFN